MMRLTSGRTAVVAGLVFWLVAFGTGHAHRVNVFAYAEGDTVHVECSYSRSNRVHFGEIDVVDAASGETYLTGKTDENGSFSFVVPAKARERKADLTIILKAGEGHQNDWVVKADEYLAAAAAPKPTGDAAAPKAESVAKSTGMASSTQPGAPARVVAATDFAATSVAAGIDPVALQALVEAAVEKKIAPVRNILLAAKEQGPGMTEVFGGIGYIVGLAGLLAYARSRRNGRGA